jgi:tRNA (guanine-N7-)-methyltransferase
LLEIPINLKVLCIDANDLLTWFNHETIDQIYINFPDPWPKKRHEKFRLTNNRFLSIYHKLLKQRSLIYLKTDQLSLYEYSIESITNSKLFKIINNSTNLYDEDKLLVNNVQTEYEKRFVSLQRPIFYLSFERN